MPGNNYQPNLDSNTNNASNLSTTKRDTLGFPWSGLSPEIIANIVFLLLLAFIIVGANLLVLASVHANSRLRRPTYYMIVSLSVADLMVGLVLLPVRVIELFFSEWTREFAWCKMTTSLTLFSLSASLLNLLAVTMDRVLAIFYALNYRVVMTPNKIFVTIATVWLTAFLTSFFPLFGVGTKSAEEYRFSGLCRFADTLDERYMALYFVFICAIPTILVSVAHGKILLLARSHERKIASLQVNSEQVTKLARVPRQFMFRRESKAAKTIATVIGLFYLCWVPFFVNILLSIFKQEVVSYLFIAIMVCIVYSNSAINPLVYGCLDSEFRNTYKQLVRGVLHLPRSRRPSVRNKPQVATIEKRGKENSLVTVGQF